MLCLDLGGPAVQVTGKVGIKVDALNPEQVVKDLASAMQQLAGEPELRKLMGQAGRQRVEEQFLWSKKAEYFSDLYFEVIKK